MSDFSFKKQQPLSLRLWHWLSAIVIIGLLFTVLFRNTFFNVQDNTQIIIKKLQESGITVSADAAKDAARGIRKPFWEWHYYLGFTLLGLTLIRLGIYFFQKNQSGSLSALAKMIPTLPSENQTQAKYYLKVRWVYAFYYVILVEMILTGITLYFKKDLHLEKNISELLKEVHEWSMWAVLAFTIVHIIGVLKEEQKTSGKGIVSDMIHGGDF